MSRAVINACQPYKRRALGDFPAVVTVPAEVAARVTERFPQVLADPVA
jgi:hypothetical protein